MYMSGIPFINPVYPTGEAYQALTEIKENKNSYFLETSGVIETNMGKIYVSQKGENPPEFFEKDGSHHIVPMDKSLVAASVALISSSDEAFIAHDVTWDASWNKENKAYDITGTIGAQIFPCDITHFSAEYAPEQDYLSIEFKKNERLGIALAPVINALPNDVKDDIGRELTDAYKARNFGPIHHEAKPVEQPGDGDLRGGDSELDRYLEKEPEHVEVDARRRDMEMEL